MMMALALSVPLLLGTGVIVPAERHALATRKHSGIPSVAVSPVNGRLWASWYAGRTAGEDQNNYCILATSADQGKTWKEVLVSEADGDGPIRVFDPQLFVAPDGRLRWTWSEQVCDSDANYFERPYGGDEGDPKTARLKMLELDAENEPSGPYAVRDVCRGVMACKPAFLADGTWLLPVAWWGENVSSRCYASTDGGRTFEFRGGTTFPDNQATESGIWPPDENEIVPLGDGSLLMFIRTEKGPLECVSVDGGRAWTKPTKARFGGTPARIACRRLRTGDLLLVKYGPFAADVGRRELSAFLSNDDGRTWSDGFCFDAREGVSYPDFDEGADGKIYCIYDRDRLGAQEINLAAFTVAEVKSVRAVCNARVRGVPISRMAESASAHKGDGAPEKLVLSLLPGEYWWGGSVGGGWRMPVGADKHERLDLRIESDGNQTAPLLLSTKGRWVWCEDAFLYEFKDGVLTVETGPCPRIGSDTSHPMDVHAKKGVVAEYDIAKCVRETPNVEQTCYSKKSFAPILRGQAEGGTLRAAFEHCSKTFFPARGMAPKEWFSQPILNTWVEFNYNQNEKDILAYAKAFKDNGLGAGGVFQIDCFWQTDCYGLWTFHGDRFDDPKGMVKKLNDMGFHVILWMSPFVTMDQMPYRQLRANRGILRDSRLLPYEGVYQGMPVAWWDGYSAVYDPTSPYGRKWFRQMIRRVMKDYGVEGFFFDGGANYEYPAGAYIAWWDEAQPVDLCRAFQMMATEVPLGQCREAWKMGGYPVMQTLRDKAPKWSEMRRCITDMIAAGQLGYPFTVADLIGGGTCGNNGDGVRGLDFQSELFIRHLQIECLSPIVMFSGSPWRLFGEDTQKIVRKFLKLRERFVPRILEIAADTGRTGLPMLRSMDFEFPGCGYELVLDQFMMGSDLLVAPVVEGSVKTRKVVIPKGSWVSDLGERVTGPTIVTVETPLERLPYFMSGELAVKMR